MTTRLRLAFRQLLRRPGAYGLMVLVLALGIGVNATMFGLAEQALFRPLPVHAPDSVVRLFTRDEADTEISNGSWPWFESLRDVGAFDGVAAYSDWVSLYVNAGAPNERVAGALAGGTLFDVLGLQPQRGRLFTADDDRTVGAHPVAVVSDRYWRTRLNASESAVGSRIVLNRQPYDIVGVLPPGFHGPSLGTRVDVWLPLAMAPAAMSGMIDADFRSNQSLSWLDGVARLRDGVSVAAAQQAVDAWAARQLAGRDPNTEYGGRGPHARLFTLADAAVDPYGTEHYARNAWLLVGIALVVLLIASANAAGLMAMRGDERARELAVRVSVGASARGLVAQLLTEAAVVAVFGLLLGLLFAAMVVQLIVALGPGGLLLPPDALSAVLGPRVLLLTSATAIGSVLLAAAWPARRATRIAVVDALRSGSSNATADGSRQRWRIALVAGQLALTLMLLVGAGLLLRTLWNVTRVDAGFPLEHRAAIAVNAARPDGGDGSRVFDELLARVQQQPGVHAAAWMLSVPVHSGGMRSTAISDHPQSPQGEDANVDLNIVGPGAFGALGVGLVRGRDFGAEDRAGAQPVVIVNRAYAQRFFPDADALGRRITSFSSEQGGAVIVGIVDDYRQRSLREPPPPQAYLPLAQNPVAIMHLLVHADDPSAVLAAVPRLAAQIDPQLPVYRPRLLIDQFGAAFADERVFALLLAGFAALAVLLAATGLYGLLSQWLVARVREFGIRVALGAPRARIAALVGRQGGLLLCAGIGTGAVLSVFASRLLSGLLFGVAPFDPASFAGAVLLLAAVTAAALWMPLRRALRIEPMAALRYD